MQMKWQDLGTGLADAADDATIELAGFVATALPGDRISHCLLVPEPSCCVGCVPRDVGKMLGGNYARCSPRR
jgi:membrane dipeptidase